MVAADKSTALTTSVVLYSHPILDISLWVYVPVVLMVSSKNSYVSPLHKRISISSSLPPSVIISTVASAVLPTASVTTTVYVPVHNPRAEDSALAGLLLHEYVYGKTPPDAETSIEPLHGLSSSGSQTALSETTVSNSIRQGIPFTTNVVMPTRLPLASNCLHSRRCSPSSTGYVTVPDVSPESHNHTQSSQSVSII